MNVIFSEAKRFMALPWVGPVFLAWGALASLFLSYLTLKEKEWNLGFFISGLLGLFIVPIGLFVAGHDLYALIMSLFVLQNLGFILYGVRRRRQAGKPLWTRPSCNRSGSSEKG